MSCNGADLDVERVVSQSENLTTLLKEINASLTAIKQQNELLSNHVMRSCKCQTVPKDLLRRDPERTFDPANGESHVDHGVAGHPLRPANARHSCTVQSPIQLCDVIAVPYGDASPLDLHTHDRFEQHFDMLLEDTELQDRLSHLPPDDHRLGIPATRTNFLRHYMLEAATAPIDFRRAQKLKENLIAELNRFDEYQLKLGTGYFWIRDYDRYGNYISWNCTTAPKIVCVHGASLEKGVQIPDTEWPIDWRSVQQDGTPVAPWRRIM